MMGTGMTGWGGYGSFGMILNLIVTVGVIIGIVWLVIWLVRRAGFNGLATFSQIVVDPISTTQSQREILQARYARGEITREQYQEILEDLN
jgi:putative membrane protein